MQGITTPIGVATYSNVKIEEIQALLPTTEQQCLHRTGGRGIFAREKRFQINLIAQEYRQQFVEEVDRFLSKYTEGVSLRALVSGFLDVHPGIRSRCRYIRKRIITYYGEDYWGSCVAVYGDYYV